MTAPYEKGVRLSKRFLEWWNHIPEPTYDSDVRAPHSWFWEFAVPALLIVMVAILIGQALQRAGVFQ